MKNHVDNPFESPIVLDFCPGILGLERGLARTGVNCRVVAYVEIEAFVIENLVAGMEAGILDPAPIWTDAKTFDARPFRGKVHGIIGGYPCPGESLAGLREGHLYKGFLWPAIRRTIAATKPLWCFFENVDDHLTGTYPIVQRSLRNMGYAVEAGVYTAEEAGAPHERKRIFILAITTGTGPWWKWKERFFTETILRREILANSKGERFGEAWPSNQRQTEWIARRGIKLADPSGFESEIGKHMEGFQELTATPRGSDEMGDSEIERSQEHRNIAESVNKAESEQQRRRIQLRATGSGSSKWPAGQGIFQYEWEDPRTIESGVGCTIDGYNFREDILRALGNSAVEQTAELAFIDLLKKHLLNFKEKRA